MMAFPKSSILLPLVLLTFGILVTFVPSTNALKCHVCDSPDCSNPRQETCKQSNSCESTDDTATSEPIYKSKQCAVDRFPDGSCESVERHGRKLKICRCNSDLCNGKPTPPGSNTGSPSLHRLSISTWLTALATCLILKQWSHFALS